LFPSARPNSESGAPLLSPRRTRKRHDDESNPIEPTTCGPVRIKGRNCLHPERIAALKGVFASAETNLQIPCNLWFAIEQYGVNAAIATSQIKGYGYKTFSRSLEAGVDRRSAGAAIDNAGRAGTKERARAIQTY
jgi:hypothetical protein